jgi:sugar lactone lactonase YvrE
MKTLNSNSLISVVGCILILIACSKNSTPGSGNNTGNNPPPNNPPPPTLSVSSISPNNGPDSTQVTITGTAFSSTAANNTVLFNGKQGVVTSANDSVLLAIVPMLAGTGDVSVTVNGKMATGPLFTYDTTYTTTVVAPNISDPQYIAADGSGNLFVATGIEGKILEFTPAGIVSTFINFHDSAGSAEGLAFDGSGNLVAAVNYSTYTTFYRINSSGTPTIIGTDTTSISGIALDQNGNIYAANFITKTIDKVTPQGGVSQFATGLYSVSGVAVGSDGSVYAATTNNSYDPTRGVVYKFSPAGTGSAYVSGLSFGVQDGIVIDKNNNLYATCYNTEAQTQSVIEIYPNGTTKTLTTNILIPVDVTIDDNGNLYVLNFESGTGSVYGDVEKLVPR